MFNLAVSLFNLAKCTTCEANKFVSATGLLMGKDSS